MLLSKYFIRSAQAFRAPPLLRQRGAAEARLLVWRVRVCALALARAMSAADALLDVARDVLWWGDGAAASAFLLAAALFARRLERRASADARCAREALRAK